jgi:predicted DNA-binding transcriptional regulator AlpA
MPREAWVTSIRSSGAVKGPHVVCSYLTTKQVRERFGGVSRMWLWRYMREHGFPQPVQFGGSRSVRRWKVAEIEAWERERVKLAGVTIAAGTRLRDLSN